MYSLFTISNIRKTALLQSSPRTSVTSGQNQQQTTKPIKDRSRQSRSKIGADQRSGPIKDRG
ncbi:hypothetical protein, partial [Microvirga antarctica]|uniref:hypothetical protein n=1 Tax=Microvirga antarctica TaxID=2819233 RepID=UPI001B30C2E4